MSIFWQPDGILRLCQCFRSQGERSQLADTFGDVRNPLQILEKLGEVEGQPEEWRPESGSAPAGDGRRGGFGLQFLQARMERRRRASRLRVGRRSALPNQHSQDAHVFLILGPDAVLFGGNERWSVEVRHP